MKADWEMMKLIDGKGKYGKWFAEKREGGKGSYERTSGCWLRTWLTWIFVALLTQWLLDSKTPEDKKTWDRHTMPLRMLCTNDKRREEERLEGRPRLRHATRQNCECMQWAEGPKAEEQKREVFIPHIQPHNHMRSASIETLYKWYKLVRIKTHQIWWK